MSDRIPASALGHAASDGFASIHEIGPLGMITLRASVATKAEEKTLAAAVKAACGQAVPGHRRIHQAGERACAWMSPDEFLIILPYDAVKAGLRALETAFAGAHYLAADVSDARAVFRIEGPRADQVLRKLTPADLDVLQPGEMRRSRVAQVAAAFWRDGDGFTLVAFRSVATYVFGLLAESARPGSELTPGA
jgi:sarcosine oxidase, subunit gamma